MKKLKTIFTLSTLLVCLLFSGACCSQHQGQTIIEAQEVQWTPDILDNTVKVRKCTFQGHRYLIFTGQCSSGADVAGAVHDPDCTCHRKHKQEAPASSLNSEYELFFGEK